jgi:hypothetical protein
MKNTEELRRELLRIAEELVLCRYMPSYLVDDYPQKTYSASRVAMLMEKPHIASRQLAIRLRTIIDGI